MIVYITVDDNMGLMFNNRRQSQDRILRSDVLIDCGEKRLWMNSYSESLFDKTVNKNIIIDDDFLYKAKEADCCYVETYNLTEFEAKISKIVLYRWNRVYPADLYLEINLSEWKLVSSKEFVGSSHNRITKEVWVHE